jgi:hypothetical protein
MMMKQLRRTFYPVLTVVIAALVTVAPLRAQTGKADWNNLKQVKPDQAVEVVLKDAKSHKGGLQSVSDDGIVVRLASGEQTFARQNVLRVSSKRQGHRLRNALIGGVIGAGAGLGVGIAADRCPPNSIVCFGNKGKAIATPAVGLIGFGIGAAIPTGGWQEIYRAR